MSTPAALIVGGDSLIGRALKRRLVAEGYAVLVTTRRHAQVAADAVWLDLSEDLGRWRPPERLTVAYLCAAVTSLQHCREDPAATRAINVDALGRVAEALNAAGARVVGLSTNLVFDGSQPCPRPEDPVCPVTEYGRQKAELEARLLRHPANAVVRLTKVLTTDLPVLLRWRQALQAGEPIAPFSDLLMAPLSLDLVVNTLTAVGRSGLTGILQVSAPDDASYADLAALLALQMGADPALVRPVTVAQSGAPVEHVAPHTTLDTTRLSEELGLQPPAAQAVLDGVVSSLLANS